MTLLVPAECTSNSNVARYLEALLAADNAIDEVISMDLSQSMRNGGGPACLRLRVVLTETEQAALGGNTRMDAALYAELCDWVERNYREQLSVQDLATAALFNEIQTAFAELSEILQLRFQPF